MADEYDVPVVRSFAYPQYPDNVIGKAHVDKEARKISIIFPDDGELSRFLELGRIVEVSLSVGLNEVDVKQAEEFRAWQGFQDAKK